MKRSPKFETVLNYYRMKLWNKARVRDAVIMGWITADEYKQITKEDYGEE